MKLRIVQQLFGDEVINNKITKIGPCVLCKYLRRHANTRYCHYGTISKEYLFSFTNAQGIYFNCPDFTLRNRKKRIKLI